MNKKARYIIIFVFSQGIFLGLIFLYYLKCNIKEIDNNISLLEIFNNEDFIIGKPLDLNNQYVTFRSDQRFMYRLFYEGSIKGEQTITVNNKKINIPINIKYIKSPEFLITGEYENEISFNLICYPVFFIPKNVISHSDIKLEKIIFAINGEERKINN